MVNAGCDLCVGVDVPGGLEHVHAHIHTVRCFSLLAFLNLFCQVDWRRLFLGQCSV